MHDDSLPDLEATLGDLVLDLLRARQMYPQLVFSVADGRGKISADAVRVTQQYVMALLDYGFRPVDEELELAVRWFATPFPVERYQRVDSVELSCLESLLLIAPQNEYVQPRLKQLLSQQLADGYHLQVEAGNQRFDTLWALKVVLLARQRGVLEDIMPDEQLFPWADRVLGDSHLQEKDIALALNLHHQLFGGLSEPQENQLANLIESARESGGVWGLPRDMVWLTEHMVSQQLTAGHIADHRGVFHDMIMNTCYVIENLLPLANGRADLQDAIHHALETWWWVFHGRESVSKLHRLFPEPYEYLRVITRTISTVCAVMEGPMLQQSSAYFVRRMANEHARQMVSPDEEALRRAVRKWIQIDLQDEPESLKLGMSGSDVVRVQPRIWHPLHPYDTGSRIEYADSLIVKYGPLEEINAERDNFNRLPQKLRELFVQIPKESHKEQGRAFVVMQDLYNYRTLYETVYEVPQAREALLYELPPFLRLLHQGDVRQPFKADYGLIGELYLLPMQEYVGRIFNHIRQNALLDAEKQQDASELQQELFELIGRLVQRQFQLEGFPLAYMHGDLHTRNVMVRYIKRRERNQTGINQELDFKLIDLEKFRVDGDMALDAGQILEDIRLTMAQKTNRDMLLLETLSETLSESYMGFAEERDDDLFPIRLDLGRARALLRVSKGKTKQSQAALHERRRGRAITISMEVLNHADWAARYLGGVLDALAELGQPVNSPFTLPQMRERR